MAFSVVGWSETQDSAGVLVQVAAIPDQHVTTAADDVLVPDFAPNLMGAFALGTTITLARLSSPSMRRSSLYDISPVNVGAEPLTPYFWHDRHLTPRPLTPGEGLRALVAEGAAGVEFEEVFVWLMDKVDPLPTGEIQTIRMVGATACVAETWTLCPLVLGQQLEAGRYAIVGMRAISASCLAARLVIPGSPFRPGVVGQDAETDIPDDIFRYGNLGVWGEFEHTFPPQAEFCCGAADAAEVVYLDIIKIG